MSNPETVEHVPLSISTPEPVEEEIDYEAMAEAVKLGVDHLLSATKRSNGKQISFQVGEVSRNLIAFSKACMADIKSPRIVK